MHFFFYHFEKFYINSMLQLLKNNCTGTDELKINFKHLLACGAFFWQIGHKPCTFQKWFYNWSCTLS